MEQFQIETAQNIRIKQNVAGIGDRILAYLLDGLIIGGFVCLVVLIGILLELDSDFSTILPMLFLIPILFYDLLFELLGDGKTIGKRALKLKVVKLDGTHPSFYNFFIRWMLRIIDITFTSGGIAIFTILINGKGQRLGDIAAGTTVISEKKKTTIENTLLVDLPEDYQPTFPQVTIFKDSEIQTIKKLYDQALIDRNHKIINSLNNRILEVTDIKTDLLPINFVGTIIKDYNYYTQNM